MPAPITALLLSHSPIRERADALLALCVHLIDLLAEHAPDDPSVDTAAFRAQVETWRQQLHDEDGPGRVASLTHDIAVACEAFLDATRVYHADRESELVQLVNVLRDGIDTVRGNSNRFEKELIRSTTAMGRMVEIEDIRELKRSLTREVQTLRTAVAERQAREATHYDQLATRVQTLEQSLVRAKSEAATDALTKLPNRGAFDVAVREWVNRAARDGHGFTVAMVDLDDFKRINDSYGHPVGDRVIMAAAERLAAGIGPGELASRFGGEEFALLLKSATAAVAHDRLQAVLDALPPSYGFELDGQQRFVSFTFSGGVTAYVAGDTTDSIVKRADEALYDAKRRGKKRIETRPRSFLRGLMR